MIYLVDELPEHPKIFRAGAILGTPDGVAAAFALYVSGIRYARKHLTDGLLPFSFAHGSPIVNDSKAVAKALSDPSVNLWIRTPDGYRIHHYHHLNPKASKVKKIRKEWREKKAAQRRGGNGEYRRESRGDTRRDTNQDSRALITYHVPQCTSTNKPRSVQTGFSTACVLTDASRRDSHAQKENHDGKAAHVPRALRDRHGGARARSDDRRRRMERTDQASACRAGMGLSFAAAPNVRRHDPDGARAPQAWHYASDADARATDVRARAVAGAARRDHAADVPLAVGLRVRRVDRRRAPAAPGERQAA